MYDRTATGGAQRYSIVPPMANWFTTLRPAASVSPMFKEFGFSGEEGSPWADIVRERVAGGLPYLYGAINPAATAGSGFADYMRNVLAGSVGRPGGSWMTTDQFANALRAVAGRGSTVAPGQALYGAFGEGVSSDDQFQTLRNMVASGSTMAMNPLASTGMLRDLNRLWAEYNGLLNMGQLAAGEKFRDYLANQTNYFQTWMPQFA